MTREELENLLIQAIALERECKNIIEILDQELGILEMDEAEAKTLLEDERTSSFIFVEGDS